VPLGIVKAATYHGLVIEERAGAWHGRVYFDV
jgi:SHS2 domain-containing protein